MYPPATHTDEQLVVLMQQDNESAFTEIYNRYWKPLYISAHNILQLKTAAQDAVQEVFISLWKRRKAVQIESLKAYLFQAVRFQTLKAIRTERTDHEFFNRLSKVSKDILTEDPLLFKELEGILKQVFSSLPADEQEIFRLHREGGLTYREIAEEKNISVKTVEKKMSQALKRMRNGMDTATVFILFTEVLK